jgi:hypothetical protein
MKRFLFCPVLLITCACAGSVFDSTPSVDPARASIEAQLAAQFRNQQDSGNSRCAVPNGVLVANIHKTDGQALEVSGAKAYRIFYEGEFEFTTDGQVADFGLLVLFHCDSDDLAREVRKGQRAKFTGSMQFEKTENGWQPDRDATWRVE